jgi:hypothetical protein
LADWLNGGASFDMGGESGLDTGEVDSDKLLKKS